jgi:hypothetical protein
MLRVGYALLLRLDRPFEVLQLVVKSRQRCPLFMQPRLRLRMGSLSAKQKSDDEFLRERRTYLARDELLV